MRQGLARIPGGLPTRAASRSYGRCEVEEAARGSGLRRAVGELLVCPDCLGQWVAGGFLAGLVAAPRPTRAVAAMFTVYAAADALQMLNAAAK